MLVPVLTLLGVLVEMLALPLLNSSEVPVPVVVLVALPESSPLLVSFAPVASFPLPAASVLPVSSPALVLFVAPAPDPLLAPGSMVVKDPLPILSLPVVSPPPVLLVVLLSTWPDELVAKLP